MAQQKLSVPWALEPMKYWIVQGYPAVPMIGFKIAQKKQRSGYINLIPEYETKKCSKDNISIHTHRIQSYGIYADIWGFCWW